MTTYFLNTMPTIYKPILAVFLIYSSYAMAAKPVLECHQDERTDAMKCIDITNVRSLDQSVRIGPLYSGGPAGVRKTNFSVAANCVTGVTHLKDRDGVTFSGGYGDETPAIKKLKDIVCSANVKK